MPRFGELTDFRRLPDKGRKSAILLLHLLIAALTNKFYCVHRIPSQSASIKGKKKLIYEYPYYLIIDVVKVASESVPPNNNSNNKIQF